MVEAALTERDRENLRILTEELPKVRILLEELIETLDVLGDEELMKSIEASGRDVQEGGLMGFKELLKELGLNEREI
ncbi:MAG: hypothetical protein QXU06_00870 [Candidatus Bathyarchaeia archaeon]